MCIKWNQQACLEHTLLMSIDVWFHDIPLVRWCDWYAGSPHASQNAQKLWGTKPTARSNTFTLTASENHQDRVWENRLEDYSWEEGNEVIAPNLSPSICKDQNRLGPPLSLLTCIHHLVWSEAIMVISLRSGVERFYQHLRFMWKRESCAFHME